MRIQLVISVSAIIAIMAMVTPAFAQGFCGIPAGCGFGAPFGGFGPGPVCGGFGAPFGIGPCGFGSPLLNIVGLGMAMIESVIGAAISCIPLGLGGLGFGGCGIPFGGF